MVMSMGGHVALAMTTRASCCWFARLSMAGNHMRACESPKSTMLREELVSPYRQGCTDASVKSSKQPSLNGAGASAAASASDGVSDAGTCGLASDSYTSRLTCVSSESAVATADGVGGDVSGEQPCGGGLTAAHWRRHRRHDHHSRQRGAETERAAGHEAARRAS